MSRRMRTLVTACVLAAPAVASAEPSPSALRRAIEPIVSQSGLAAASWGIEVRSLKTGRVLYARDETRALRPASTLKLVTTAAALDVFGSEARIVTTVETAGRQDALGRILGDVYLVGRGDPTLSARSSPGQPTAAFETLADLLVVAGIRRIEGRLIGHEGAFAGDRRGHDWTWEDLVWGYGAEVSALSFDENGVELRLRPGERPGDPALLEASILSPLLPVVSEVVTVDVGSLDDLRLEDEGPPRRIRLSGRLPIGGQWSGRVAVEDPALFATTVFASVLEAPGIRVVGGVTTTREPIPAASRVLAAREGATIGEIVRLANKESLNLYAESLLRLVGLRRKGEGSVEKGREVVLEMLKRLEVPTEGWLLSDGSGLSRTNLATAHGLVALLLAMERHPQAAAYRDSLAVAGMDGTLERRLRGTAAEGRVQAKSGTLSLAQGLAGHAITRRGDRVAFAILVNNHSGGTREVLGAIDAVVRAIVGR